MAKSTKVMDLAATLNMDCQQLIEQINALGLGFNVRAKTSALTDEQVRQIQQKLSNDRSNRSNSAIDAKSQSTAKGTVRVRRRREVDSTPAEKTEDTAKVAAKPASAKAAKPAAAKAAPAKPVEKAAPAKVEPVVEEVKPVEVAKVEEPVQPVEEPKVEVQVAETVVEEKH